MTENELRLLVREQILNRFNEKRRNLHEETKNLGSEKESAKTDPTKLATALGIKSSQASAIKDALSKDQRNANQDKMLAAVLIKIISADDKQKNDVITALKQMKVQPGSSKKEEPKKEGRMREQSEEKVDPDVEAAIEDLDSLDASMQGLVSNAMGQIKSDEAKSGEGKKKDESLTVLAAGLIIGLPGLLKLMSGMAKLLAKGINKIFKTKIDTEKEGETLARAAEKLHHKYIGWLKPVVKIVFKKQIGKDEQKAQKYAEVTYAVILAAVAAVSAYGAGAGMHHVLHGVPDAVHTAYEAAHSAHAGIESGEMMSAFRAALAAVDESAAAEALASAASAA